MEGGGETIFSCGSWPWGVCDLVEETRTWTSSGDKFVVWDFVLSRKAYFHHGNLERGESRGLGKLPEGGKMWEGP